MPNPFARRSACFALLVFVALAAIAVANEPDRANAPKMLRAGAFAIDITPTQFPVIVNGYFEERVAEGAVDRLFARALVLDDGATQLVLVIVDSLMLPRDLLDEVKSRASQRTGVPTDHMLISATHSHSAPSAMGCLGSRPDPDYPGFLIPRIVRAIESAHQRMQPAQIGWTKIRAPEHTFCRRYIRRPDRLLIDPFGQPTVRAHMHPGFVSSDAVGPSGPVDDELSLLAVQTLEGKPLAVLANFSMHYVGSLAVSADYFGRFSEHLAKRIDGSDGATSCIVAMSQGTSGDLMGMNYSAPATKLNYDSYADELAEMAHVAYRQIEYHQTVPLAIQEAKLTVGRRVPDVERLTWAKSIAATVGDRRPKGWPEIYALEQLMLAEEPQRELKLQAARIGDVGITAIPNEVFGITGLKLKLQSPLPFTFNIELANGADGYIPPPEQHALGGYTTWPARTAGLEVDAEPKIVETLLTLLEEVASAPRKPFDETGCAYSEAVLKSQPRAYWRLSEIAGDVAADASDRQLDARYEAGIARYLLGPASDGLLAPGQVNRAAHFAGGRLRASVPDIGETYSVELWFWNGLPADARPVAGYLFSRGPNGNDEAAGDHLAIGGLDIATGRLLFFNGNRLNQVLEGRTPIEPQTWNHVVVVRDGEVVRAYLNGRSEPEIDGRATVDPQSLSDEWFFGGRSDNFANLEGKLDEAAVYDHALSPQDAAQHYQAAGTPPSGVLGAVSKP
ncbi:MAG: neutral/alkaline non-lysosomal ceramidase N-terminal domain-containing protein [Pirellulales bacterium]